MPHTPGAPRVSVSSAKEGIFELPPELKPGATKPYYPAVNRSTTGRISWMNTTLNPEQKRAVLRVLQAEARPLPYVIYGPPGTGKTVTVVECILQTFLKLPHSRILVATPSNSSADLIVQRLIAPPSPTELRGQLVRLNAFNRSMDSVPEEVVPFSLVADDVDSLRAAVSRHRILVSTAATAGNLRKLLARGSSEEKGIGFTHCFVDEAGHLSEPETLLAMALLGKLERGTSTKQVVLAGDPMQLGPVIQSGFAKSLGLAQSFLERLCHCKPYLRDKDVFRDHGGYDPLLVTKLVRNYRSHRDIIKVSSDLFYFSELKSHAPKTIRRRFVGLPFLPKRKVPIVLHGIRGHHFQEADSPSWYNPQEAYQVFLYLKELFIEKGIRHLIK